MNLALELSQRLLARPVTELILHGTPCVSIGAFGLAPIFLMQQGSHLLSNSHIGPVTIIVLAGAVLKSFFDFGLGASNSGTSCRLHDRVEQARGGLCRFTGCTAFGFRLFCRPPCS
jgi:hypothetical protein